MEFISNLPNFLFESVIPFIVLLGLLIFVHEAGHFLVAKLCGVRVETFSLGFGKKILQFKKDYTTYCISLIPLGGYVKMFGDDPSMEIPEEEKKVAFNHKPVGQRIAVVLAGPLMNFFFAIFLFAGVGFLGEQALPPVLGDLAPSSAAWKAGFRPGDRVQTVDGKSISTWKEFDSLIKENSGNSLTVSVVRNDGDRNTLKVTPAKISNPNVLEWADRVGNVEGLAPTSKTSHVTIAKDSLAAKAGVLSIDQVTAINGQKIRYWRELKAFRADNIKTLRVKRHKNADVTSEDFKEIDLSVDSGASATTANWWSEFGFESPDLVLSRISKDSPAEKAGLLVGDRLISINGEKLTQWSEVLDQVNKYKADDSALNFKWSRNGEIMTAPIRPQMSELMNSQGQEIQRFLVGISPAIFNTVEKPILKKTSGLIGSLQRGWEQTIDWTNTTVLSFVRLLQNRVSSKNIGGIFTIGQVASESFRLGLSPYLKMMAIISINLFILNLLPVPVLDGGHLVFFTIEAIKGSPLSLKKMEFAQQIGVLLLMGLMAYSIMNDISRLW